MNLFSFSLLIMALLIMLRIEIWFKTKKNVLLSGNKLNGLKDENGIVDRLQHEQRQRLWRTAESLDQKIITRDLGLGESHKHNKATTNKRSIGSNGHLRTKAYEQNCQGVS